MCECREVRPELAGVHVNREVSGRWRGRWHQGLQAAVSRRFLRPARPAVLARMLEEHIFEARRSAFRQTSSLAAGVPAERATGRGEAPFKDPMSRYLLRHYPVGSSLELAVRVAAGAGRLTAGVAGRTGG